MPYIQENRVKSYWNGKRVGKKDHIRHSITIPKDIIEHMKWKKGDEIKFIVVDGKHIFLKKKEV